MKIEIQEYKNRHKGQELKEEKLFKQIPQAIKGIKETKEGLTIDFIISTSAIDRDTDTLNADGWDFTNYRKNPVVLWAHDKWEPPVAKSLHETIEDGLVKSTALFVPKEISEFSYMIGQMYKEGFLNAVSVGFKSQEAKWAADEENRPWGIDFLKQELLEYSCVPVPANPEALIDAKSIGIDLAPMLEYAVKCLDLRADTIPQDTAEKIYNILKNKSVFVIPKLEPQNAFLMEKSKMNMQAKINQNLSLRRKTL